MLRLLHEQQLLIHVTYTQSDDGASFHPPVTSSHHSFPIRVHNANERRAPCRERNRRRALPATCMRLLPSSIVDP